MRLSMREIGESNVLAGAQNGSRVFAKLLSATTREPRAPEPLFLDFDGVDVATASFLRESVQTLRDHVRGRRSTLYPVIANANDTLRDELVVLVRSRGDVLILCTLDKDEHVSNVERIGELDPKQQMTLDIVCERGEIDAGELMREYGEAEQVRHTTAWNNRLAALSMKGLLVELSQGRNKRYRPILEGL